MQSHYDTILFAFPFGMAYGKDGRKLEHKSYQGGLNMGWIAFAIVIFGICVGEGLTNIGKGLSNLGEYIAKKKEEQK